MKIRVMLLLLIGAFCLTSFSQTDLDKASKISFIGIRSVKLTCDNFTTGDLIMTVNVEYENKNEEEIIISKVKAKTLVIDKNFKGDDDELFSLAYHDYCEDGCQLKKVYKNFEVGEYVPEANSIRQSIRFAKGVNIMKLNFNLGNLIDKERTNKAEIDDKENFKVASKPIIDNVIRISNALNGEDKNDSKLVFLFEGLGNIMKDGRIITLPVPLEFRMAYPLSRRHVDYIFQDKDSIK